MGRVEPCVHAQSPARHQPDGERGEGTLRLWTLWLLLVPNSNAAWLLGPKYSTAMRATPIRTGIVIVVFFLVAICTAKADIQIDRTSSNIRVWITNTIKESDAKQLQEISAELEFASPLVVWLDSKGGDVSAAIKIGKLIRKYDGQTIIGSFPAVIAENPKCYSSCALIFNAGVRRAVIDGVLGLHRPYLSALPQSRETVEKQVPLMLSMLKNYVNEMGITDNFYQQMVNTEPSRMMMYYSDNYTGLVPEIDAVYAEVEIARDARRYGITTSEMRQREQDEKSCERFIPNDSSR